MGGKPRLPSSEALTIRKATRQNLNAVRRELARSRVALRAALRRLDNIDKNIARSTRLVTKTLETKTIGGESPRRSELIALLRHHSGNVSEIARRLGKARVQVRRWAAVYEIEVDDYR